MHVNSRTNVRFVVSRVTASGMTSLSGGWVDSGNLIYDSGVTAMEVQRIISGVSRRDH